MSEETKKELLDAKYKRSARNIFIHKPMQREFSLVLIALLMVSTVAVGFVIHSTIREAVFGGGFRFGKVSVYEVLSDVSYQLVVRVSCILLAAMIVIGLFGVFFLHRVAGPVYRFRRVLMRLNDGELPPPIHLREGDFFIETATEINSLLKKFEFERQKTRMLEERLDQMLASHPPDAISRVIREMQGMLKSNPE